MTDDLESDAKGVARASAPTTPDPELGEGAYDDCECRECMTDADRLSRRIRRTTAASTSSNNDRHP